MTGETPKDGSGLARPRKITCLRDVWYKVHLGFKMAWTWGAT
jgi:hypothetical protein